MRAPGNQTRRQAGWSIISLMVGMLVSMLVILSMLSLFRVVSTNVVHPTTGMQPTASQDRQIATALLSVQTLLQNAGYGYYPQAAHNVNVMLVSGASKTLVSAPVAGLTGNTLAATSTITVSGTVQSIASGTVTPPLANAVNALFWETAGSTVPASASSAQCYGLLSDTSSLSNGNAANALYLLQANGSCSPVNANWNNINWTVTPLISSGLMLSPVTFAAQETTCWPFSTLVGANAPSGLYVQLSWSTNSTSALSSAAKSWSSCLPNIS
ncbi:PilW family protein [Silvimonas iriomotensis]|uniref:Uncharacterized protein n=1 Tax=Silvimonas iriomotensis TaxID=449662 RepID=A0ABQ2P9C7_9NEIS|nr:hypothetical protein [Silvimonas iriomotensis]GGP21081.1 hypothetical protein GCM10010970_18620 [Silvimonas iriomotensis]